MPEENASTAASSSTTWQLAKGRQLPPLLFITSRQVLAANIGQTETADLLQGLQNQKALVYDGISQGAAISTAANTVKQQLQSNPTIQGIVLLGGYDVLPAQRLDVLDPDLRNALPPNSDADNFIVWSDDVYGDINDDGLPELPVSRIPDGKSVQLVVTALKAGNSSAGIPRAGLRNVHRLFADEIFASLPGTEPMLTSAQTVFNQNPPYSLTADHVYLMLHGYYANGGCFWGEDPSGSPIEAMHISNVPARSGQVIFTGCCWGALPVESRAADITSDQSVEARTVQTSIALNFLANGALAFIGCTGSHYSPTVSPYQYYGAPLHAAFWTRYLSGSPPAKALFEAKYIDYIKGIPHGSADSLTRAIENKILREYTCLGLGW